MTSIKAIDSSSVHQIQSGQVIVDLCSVVKELVENSLDAGATSLEIRFKNNGLDQIEVQDNGCGIAPEDYRNVALKSHTSKLSSYGELTLLQTFGFRGEALSSLCGLSNFGVTTAQEHQAPKASKLDFEASGQLKSVQTVAGQKGTTCSVHNLFKTLPVRRKELEKNIKREYGKVLSLLHAYACISTGVRFQIKNQMPNGRKVVVFTTNGNSKTRENIANIYGSKTLLALVPLELELQYEPTFPTRSINGRGDDDQNHIIVHGHISKPIFGEGRQTPDRQMFFVNRRPCAVPQIAKAFNEVYKSFNVSQSPFIFADFEMDTSAYDVNVAPDKRTILLHEAGALIESLKLKLTRLFESLDQTVPQSQLATKQSTLIRSSSKDMEAGAPMTPKDIITQDQEKRTSKGSDRGSTMKNFVRNFASQNSSLILSSPSSDQPSVPEVAEPEPSQSSSEPSHEPEQQSAVTDKTPPPPASTEDPFISSQSSIQSVQQSPVRHAPGPVQNAFDRMRPQRPAKEVPTITIGNNMVQSTLDGSIAKRKSSNLDLNTPSRSSKRQIRVVTRKRSGLGLGAFAAPGTQIVDEDESGNEEDESEEDSSNELTAVTPHNNEDHEMRNAEPTSDDVEEEQGGDGAEEDEDGDGDHAMQEAGNFAAEQEQRDVSGPDLESEATASREEPEAESDEDFVDEEEKKVREEARVESLIKAAEQKASVPSKQSSSKADNLSQISSRKDATYDLTSTVRFSLESLDDEAKALEEYRQRSIKLRNETKPRVEVDTSADSAEKTLSLTVTKEDFARMRIIGQFNLGFIIVTKPHPTPSSSSSSKQPTSPDSTHDRDELLIIDQHASDEKYNFERLQAETVVQNQRLVKPKVLDLTAVEEEVIIDNIPALEHNGFVVEVDTSGDEPIGRRCKLVSLPLSKEVVFDTRDLEELVVLLSEMPSTSSTQTAKPGDASSVSIPRPSKTRKMFAMRACRSSIMVGKTLTAKQMGTIIHHMGMIDKPWNCPHGRPTMRHLTTLRDWSEWNEWACTGDSDYEVKVGGDDGDSSDACLPRQETLGPGLWREYLSKAEEDAMQSEQELGMQASENDIGEEA